MKMMRFGDIILKTLDILQFLISVEAAAFPLRSSWQPTQYCVSHQLKKQSPLHESTKHITRKHVLTQQ